MKKKIFFVVSSLGAGGSERVFWLLAQGFDKSIYDVYIIHFDSRQNAFSTQLEGVTVVDLKTIKASRSFFKLYRFIKQHKPHAVFSTASHLNILVAMIAIFTPIPKIIARESNVYGEMSAIGGRKVKFWALFINAFYKKFDAIVCQSAEMQQSFLSNFSLSANKLIIIPNPIADSCPRPRVKHTDGIKHILIVARLAPEKAHLRLLKVLSILPDNFHLTIAGDGPCRDEITAEIQSLKLEKRVTMLGEVKNVNELLSQHDLCVLSSLTEGFPNALLESLAIGTPVVTFKVGGVSELVKPGFNGYMIEQNDLVGYYYSILRACTRSWEYEAISRDIQSRFSLRKVSNAYQSLI